MPFSDNFCKSLIIKRINRIYGFTCIQRYTCSNAHSYERLATQQLVIFMIQRTLILNIQAIFESRINKNRVALFVLN